MSKPTGYIVVDANEDGTIEQPLCLAKGDRLPQDGVLTYAGNSVAGEPRAKHRAVFATAFAARRAIARTGHYRAAFGFNTMPDPKDCRIVPVRSV